MINTSIREQRNQNAYNFHESVHERFNVQLVAHFRRFLVQFCAGFPIFQHCLP